MESLLRTLNLEDSDDEQDAVDRLEPLGEQELKLMNLIKGLIQKRKYKDIPKLFTKGKYASSNVEMLPKMSMHLYRDVCEKHLTEETYEDNRKLYKCAEELLSRIAECAPVEDFLFEMTMLLDASSPECVFVSALNAVGSTLLRVPDDGNKMATCAFEDCLDEISLRRDLYSPMPTYLMLGNNAETAAHMDTDEDLQYIIMFQIRVELFYRPILTKICSQPRPETELFRSCKPTKLNMLCCFLIKMLNKPLALFDLRLSEANHGNKCPVFCALSLTQAISKCIGDPLFLLNFAEQTIKWDSESDSDSDLSVLDEEDGNYFIKKFSMDSESLAIYYYMVIVEGIYATEIPKVYNPLYVCEMGLYLVHSLLTQLPAPTLQDKALRLAIKLFTNLRHIKIPSSYLDLFIYRAFLNDLRQLALKPLTANILLQTVNALKQYIVCFVDDDRYMILKSLIATVNHPCFSGYLITMYNVFAAEALKASSVTSLPKVYSGQQLYTIMMEHICKLKQGVKTDPAEFNDRIEAALELIYLYATGDKENNSGFWSFVNEIQSQFISPLRKALQFYESRYKTELQKAMRDRAMWSRGGIRGGKLSSHKDRSKHIDELKNNIANIIELRNLLATVSESLTNSPIDLNTVVDANSNPGKAK